jgi:hypothetical protein
MHEHPLGCFFICCKQSIYEVICLESNKSSIHLEGDLMKEYKTKEQKRKFYDSGSLKQLRAIVKKRENYDAKNANVMVELRLNYTVNSFWKWGFLLCFICKCKIKIR